MRRFSIKTPAGELEYRIARRQRVRKRMHMELDATGKLVVIAPGHWSETQVDRVLRQNISRVERFMLHAKARQLPPLQYCDNERHLFLGQSYPLTVKPYGLRNGAVEFDGKEIVARLPEITSVKTQELLQHWYRQQALLVFNQRMKLISAQADWARGRELTLKLRRMKRTWGNCSSSGVIKLNTHLIKAPLSVIDSVVAHELCHLVEMNHGKAFYTLLENLNPNWKQDRKQLVSEGYQYLR